MPGFSPTASGSAMFTPACMGVGSAPKGTGKGKAAAVHPRPLLAGTGLVKGNPAGAQSGANARAPRVLPGPSRLQGLFTANIGDMVSFDPPLQAMHRCFTGAVIVRDYRTASRARHLAMQPGDIPFICKFEDLWQEYAIMSVVTKMNQRWAEQGVFCCGVPVQAVTYGLVPLGPEGGLVEVVRQSATMRELAQECSIGDRHLRILKSLPLHSDPRCLNTLAASTVAYLTMCYILGIRDGHDDNIMLRADGALFRVDFGFVFGRTPEVDAPRTVLPHAVRVALGEHKWNEVVGSAVCALQALSGTHGPLGWDCIRSVPELGSMIPEAFTYVKGLSLQDFVSEVRHADDWSLQRAVKNTVRETIRYVLDGR